RRTLDADPTFLAGGLAPFLINLERGRRITSIRQPDPIKYPHALGQLLVPIIALNHIFFDPRMDDPFLAGCEIAIDREHLVGRDVNPDRAQSQIAGLFLGERTPALGDRPTGLAID